MLEYLYFVLNTVLPVFLLVIAGIVFKQLKIVDDKFITSTSNFVYKVSLPVLIFLKLYDVELSKTFDLNMIVVIVSGTVITYFIGLLFAKNLNLEPQNEGVFVQGSFRSNFAIVGLAIILRMYGTESLARASFLVLFALPLYNLLSIVALTTPFAQSRKMEIRKTLLEIVSNPLLLAVVIAILFSISGIGLHNTIKTTADFLASIALPLALVSIGGSLNMKTVIEASGNTIYAALIKNILAPLVAVLIAYALNIRGNDLGILFIIFACPTAIASFIFAAGMKGNIKLAGNIIIVSTLGSIVTIISGLFILKYIELI